MAQVWAGRRYREEGMGKGGREREGGRGGKGRGGEGGRREGGEGGEGGREGRPAVHQVPSTSVRHTASPKT